MLMPEHLYNNMQKNNKDIFQGNKKYKNKPPKSHIFQPLCFSRYQSLSIFPCKWMKKFSTPQGLSSIPSSLSKSSGYMNWLRQKNGKRTMILMWAPVRSLFTGSEVCLVSALVSTNWVGLSGVHSYFRPRYPKYKYKLRSL